LDGQKEGLMIPLYAHKVMDAKTGRNDIMKEEEL
jgi:hypothetical protein